MSECPMAIGRRSRSIVVCILVMFTLARSEAQSREEDGVVGPIHVAAEKAGKGDISSATADMMAVLATNPNSALGWYELGSILGQSGDFRAAETALRHAIGLDPGLSKAHFELALTLIANPQENQNWQDAILECREALKYQPNYVEALNLLGAALSTTGQITEAIQVLRRAVELAPALAEAHFNLALSLEKGDRLEEAANEYRAAIAMRRGYPEAMCAFGKLLLREGKPAEAQQEFEGALHINPDLTDAHYNLARLLRAQKDDAQAKIEFAEAKELMSRQPNAIQSAELSNQGLELAGKGDHAQAITLLHKAISLKANYGVPHFNLGLVLAADGQTTEAIQELTKAISLMPSEYKTWLNLGRVLKQGGDFDGAYYTLAWAGHLSPTNPAVKAELASLRANDPQRATKLESEPRLRRPDVGAVLDTAEGHYKFAVELIERGDFEGAVGELLRSLSIEPGMSTARRSLGESFEKMKENDRAVLEYSKLIRLNDKDSSAHLAIGKLLAARGETDQALIHLRKAVEFSPTCASAREALLNAEKLINKQ
jgi:tetratricopeptide (TPR) repeat protein